MKLAVFLCTCAHTDEWPDWPGCVVNSVTWEFVQMYLLDSSSFLGKIKDKFGLCFSPLSIMALHIYGS